MTDPSASLSIDRTSLSLDPLVIEGREIDGPMWLRVGGVIAPDWSVRYSTAPDSAWASGKLLLSAVEDQANYIGNVVLGPAPDAVTLKGYRDELEAALGQFLFNMTLTIDGVSETWHAQRSVPTYGDLGLRVAPSFKDVATLQIPVNR